MNNDCTTKNLKGRKIVPCGSEITKVVNQADGVIRLHCLHPHGYGFMLKVTSAKIKDWLISD